MAPWYFAAARSVLLALAAASSFAAEPLVAQSTGLSIEVAEASIADLQRAMTAGRVTAVQLVDAYLARIAAYDRAGPSLNAMIRLNPGARADAEARDAERRRGVVRGALHGIPIILKDNFDTEGWETSAGSLALATHKPARDGFIVRRLRDAGAVILGKSNMHELAAGITNISSLGGQTRNPYDPRRCPGGSSGGTGAAIAASLAAVGWGTDTCGSIRIPAAYASLFGLRPTQGLVSRSGIVPLALTQDVAGPLARTAADLAVALDATVGPDPSDPATAAFPGEATPGFTDALLPDALHGARIGIFAPYFRNADGEVADTVRAAVRAMEALGAEIIEVTMPDFDSLMANTSAIVLETKFDLMDYLSAAPNAPVRSLSEIRELGYFHAALEERHRIADTASARDSESRRNVLARQETARARILSLMDSLELDALAYPTMTRPPALVGERQLGSTCQLAAHTGLPALSMPAGFTGDGLPVGLELLGRPWSDARLVGFAYAFEQAGPRRRPPSTTPPLIDGRAPEPVAYVVNLTSRDGQVNARFTFDATTNQLAYRAEVPNRMAPAVTALVLRRVDPGGPGRVIHRLGGAGETSVIGVVTLEGQDREALAAGRLVVALHTTREVAAVASAALPQRR